MVNIEMKGLTILVGEDTTVLERTLRKVEKEHNIVKGSQRVIFFPETRLHSKEQIIKAKKIIKKVRSGQKIIMATHSSFIIEIVNIALLLSLLERNLRDELEYDLDFYVKFEEIRVYEITPKKVKPVEINKEDCITQDCYLRGCEKMHEETVRLENYLSQQEEKNKPKIPKTFKIEISEDERNTIEKIGELGIEYFKITQKEMLLNHKNRIETQRIIMEKSLEKMKRKKRDIK